MRLDQFAEAAKLVHELRELRDKRFAVLNGESVTVQVECRHCEDVHDTEMDLDAAIRAPLLSRVDAELAGVKEKLAALGLTDLGPDDVHEGEDEEGGSPVNIAVGRVALTTGVANEASGVQRGDYFQSMTA